jgi:hypothetical protein
MPRPAHPDDNKPLDIGQTRRKIAIDMSDLLASDQPGPIVLRLKPTKVPDKTYLLNLTRHRVASGKRCWPSFQVRNGQDRNHKERLMNLTEWEQTIQEIVKASNLQKNNSGKMKLLKEWRARLEKEPPRLQPFQIDKIIREVRRRLESAN